MGLRLGHTLCSTCCVLLLTCIFSASAFRFASSVVGSTSDTSEHAAGQLDAASPFKSATGEVDKPRNNRVIIGVLSQPSDPSGPGESYIAASYVKFLEASGARVVPFVHDLPKHEIKRL